MGMAGRCVTAMLVGMLALMAGGTAQARELRGTVVVAPDQDATRPGTLYVEAVDALGRAHHAAPVRVTAPGAPVAFVLTAPEGALDLRAALYVAGRPVQATGGPVTVAEGDATVDAGRLVLSPADIQPRPPAFRCAGTRLRLSVHDGAARLHSGTGALDLAPVPAASGARFSDGGSPETVVWTKGNDLSVTLAGEALAPCLPDLEATLGPLVARGNEPPWTLRIENGVGVLTAGYTQAFRAEGRLGETARLPGMRRFSDESGLLQVTVTEGVAHDDMSGMPYPAGAELRIGDRVLTGTAGAPADVLRGTAWRVVRIGAAAVPDEVEITLEFLKDRVAGNAGCNRLIGPYRLGGEGLSFGQLGVTMMACPDPQMRLERAFLDALSRVTRHDVGDDGGVVLFEGGQALLHLAR